MCDFDNDVNSERQSAIYNIVAFLLLLLSNPPVVSTALTGLFNLSLNHVSIFHEKQRAGYLFVKQIHPSLAPSFCLPLPSILIRENLLA